MSNTKKLILDFGDFFGSMKQTKLEEVFTEMDYLDEHLEVYAEAAAPQTIEATK